MVVGLLLSFNAIAEYIRVVGTGVDVESAKKNAFASAIEIYVGTIVVSEREIHNRKITKDEILLYSSGYIDDFKIVSQTQIGNQVQLILDVSVNSNKISQRILGKSTHSNVIDGDRVRAQIDTYQQERHNADKLLTMILNDYPYRAYNIEQLPYYITTNNRKMQLVMPYKLSWNYNYVMALGNVINKTQDAKPKILGRNTGMIHIYAKDPDDYIFGKHSKFEFNDLTHPSLISGNLYDNEVRIMGRIINNNNETVWYICHNPNFLSGNQPAFYSIGDVKNIKIYGNAIETNEVKLDIGPDLYRILQNSYKVQLQIVKNKDC